MNTGVECHFLLQGIFSTQGSSPHHLRLLHGQEESLPLRTREALCFYLKYFSHFKDCFLVEASLVTQMGQNPSAMKETWG